MTFKSNLGNKKSLMKMGVFTKLEQFFLQKKNRSFLIPILAFFERIFNTKTNIVLLE